MGIQYERTMRITYGKRLSDIDFRRLAGALAEQEIYVCGKFDNHTKFNYGYSEKEVNTTDYSVSSPTHGIIMNCSYRSDAIAVIEGFEHIIEGIVMEDITTTTTKKVWAEPNGNTVVCSTLARTSTTEFDGINVNFGEFGRNELGYDNGVDMLTTIANDYLGLRLTFLITWKCDKIQRTDAIEDNMVNMVKNDMGKIQALFEGRIKLKKFGYDIEDVEIHCHFDAKTESRSECAPDIIKQVRDARKGV
tara:strand:+ start:485 stop:1228 length:744 start_codon:yes stop_codon:yes gene_type:complete